MLARDLRLKTATEETMAVFALLGWVHAKGTFGEAKRVSPSLLYNRVKDTRNKFSKLEQFDGVFVKTLPRNPMEFQSKWPELWDMAFGEEIPSANGLSLNHFENFLPHMSKRITHGSMKRQPSSVHLQCRQFQVQVCHLEMLRRINLQ